VSRARPTNQPVSRARPTNQSPTDAAAKELFKIPTSSLVDRSIEFSFRLMQYVLQLEGLIAVRIWFVAVNFENELVPLIRKIVHHVYDLHFTTCVYSQLKDCLLGSMAALNGRLSR
jgi:hypothetical protein